jgi:lipopolysaccharide export system permease protein
MNYLTGGILGKTFLIQSANTLFVVFLIIFSLDFLLQIISEIEDIDNNYSFISAVNYLLLIITGRFCEILALCCVVSSILTFGLLSDSGELTAARVLGRSLFSIILDILKPVIFFLFLSLFLLEFVTPNLEKKAMFLKYGNTINHEEIKWVVKNDSFAKFKINDKHLEDVSFYKLDLEKNTKEIIVSEKVSVSKDGWIFTNPKNLENNINPSEYTWKEGPEYGFREELGRKEMSLSQIYKILDDAGPKREKNMISYEFWKKLFEPISAISIIVFALAVSFKYFGLNKNLERLLFGVLTAYGFNLFLKVFGNIAIINGFSPGLAIALPSLILLMIGLKMLRNQ